MTEVIAAFVAMLVIVAAMAIGPMFGKRPIKGSCGGLAAANGCSCSICGRTAGSCDAEPPKSQLYENAIKNDAAKKNARQLL